MTTPSFGSELRALREAAGFSQRQVGNWLGWSGNFVGHLERGGNIPPTDDKTRILLQGLKRLDLLEKFLVLAAAERKRFTFAFPANPQLAEMYALLSERELSGGFSDVFAQRLCQLLRLPEETASQRLRAALDS